MTKLTDSKYVWWFFAAATVFVYFCGLGFPLVGPDEPRYAEVAREMWQTGNWITPTLGGFDWFEKPPLLYWLQIVGYKLFGVNEFAARFGSALFGLGTIGSMWILGRFGRVKDSFGKSIEFANWLSLITATTLGILVFARGASFDIIVTFPLTASLVGFFVSDGALTDEVWTRRLGLIAFFLFAGLAVLAKGLIGIVFPFGTVFVFFAISRRLPSSQFLVSMVWGTVLLLSVAAIWNLPMYLKHGWKFIDEFYVQHHFRRFTSNKYQHPQPFYFFFWVLPLMTMPWLPFFIAAIWSGVKEFFHLRDTDKPDKDRNLRNLNADELDTIGGPQSKYAPDTDKSLRIFALAWIAVPLLFFSISGSKLPGYILPAIPGTVVFTGVWVIRFIGASPGRRNSLFLIAASTFVAVICLSAFVLPKYADRKSVKRLIESADRSGLYDSKVIGYRNVSQNAEFYAAGRLVRDEDGRQQRFDDPQSLRSFVNETEKPVLALVPLQYLSEISQSRCYSTYVIDDNGELAIGELTRSLGPCF